MMRWMWLATALLATCPAGADEPTPIRVGQAIFRPRATVTLRTLPDGTRKPVQLDIYGLVTERAEPLWIDFRSDGPLGVVVYDLDHSTPGGDPTVIATVGTRKPYRGELTTGHYMLAVASDPPTDAAYLISVARAPQPLAEIERVDEPGPADAAPRYLGSWQLPREVKGIDLSPSGGLLAAHDGQHAWLYNLDSGAVYRLATEPGAVRRVAISPDGWSVLTVTAGGALLMGLPDLTPFARFGAEPGVRDAVYAGAKQRIAVLPGEGAVYVASPVEGDLAYLPDSAGDGLAADTSGIRLAVRRGQAEVLIYDLAERTRVAETRWPAPPAILSLHPFAPLVAAAGPGATGLWEGGLDPAVSELPAAAAVAYGGTGLLALAGEDGVGILAGDASSHCEPSFAARLVAFSVNGRRLAAVGADGRLALWDTTEMAPPEPVAEPDLPAARLAYLRAMNAFKARDYEGAKAGFERALEVLGKLEPTQEIQESTCAAWLRLSQATYQLEQYDESIVAATSLLETAAQLPAGDLRKSYEAIGLYRRADAQWELGRRDQAKAGYRQALDRGLAGGRAEDARQKLAE